MIPSFLVALLSALSTVFSPHATVLMDSHTVAHLPERVSVLIEEVDTKLPSMRKVEGERPSEGLVTAFYDGNVLRKVMIDAFDEAYYLENDALFYARREEEGRRTEAVFTSGKLTAAFIEGKPTTGDEASWTNGLADAKAVLAEEAEFAKKPLSETGARMNETDVARKQLDAEAARIDAAEGTIVTKDLPIPSTEGAEVEGLTVDGELRRIQARIYGESSQTSETYYLRGGAPFLIVEESLDYTIPMYMLRSRVGGMSVRRFYFFEKDGGMNASDEWERASFESYLQVLRNPNNPITSRAEQRS